MGDNTVIISKVINAPIERIWRAWTDPNQLKHWFTVMDGSETEIIQFDVKEGGKVRLKFPGGAGEYTWTYIKIDEPKELVFDILDFSLPQFLPDGAGGICNVSLKDLGDKTEVTVSGDLAGESKATRQMAENGWGSTLDKLNNYLKKEN
ncbi:MAG: SRPBCC family protein [Candidatus Saccharimonadales bacterium]